MQLLPIAMPCPTKFGCVGGYERRTTLENSCANALGDASMVSASSLALALVPSKTQVFTSNSGPARWMDARLYTTMHVHAYKGNRCFDYVGCSIAMFIVFTLQGCT